MVHRPYANYFSAFFRVNFTGLIREPLTNSSFSVVILLGIIGNYLGQFPRGNRQGTLTRLLGMPSNPGEALRMYKCPALARKKAETHVSYLNLQRFRRHVHLTFNIH